MSRGVATKTTNMLQQPEKKNSVQVVGQLQLCKIKTKVNTQT